MVEKFQTTNFTFPYQFSEAVRGEEGDVRQRSAPLAAFSLIFLRLSPILLSIKLVSLNDGAYVPIIKAVLFPNDVEFFK